MNWKVVSSEYGYWVEDENGHLVSSVEQVMDRDYDTGFWDELTCKRARLIAAAPETLKALKTSLNALKEVRFLLPSLQPFIYNAEQAIKKAGQ